MLTKICIQCGKLFKKSKNLSMKTWNNRTKFCSKNCHSKSLTGKLQAKSHKQKISKSMKLVWYNEIYRRPLIESMTNTLNKKFKYKYTSRECYYCGTEFKINIKCAYLRNEGKYCSRKCLYKDLKTISLNINNSNWRGGISLEPYGMEFTNELKKRIRERDNNKCIECGVSSLEENLQIHHIDYNKKNNNENNLVTLCSSCHGRTGGSRNDWISYFNFKMNIPEEMVIR